LAVIFDTISHDAATLDIMYFVFITYIVFVIKLLMVIPMPKSKDLTYWNIPVSKALDDAVEEAVRRDMYVSKSDLVRDAVRRLLRELDITRAEVRDYDLEG